MLRDRTGPRVSRQDLPGEFGLSATRFGSHSRSSRVFQPVVFTACDRSTGSRDGLAVQTIGASYNDVGSAVARLMPRSTTRRHGYGDLDQPNLLFTVHTATCKFLSAVTQRYPVVLDELGAISVEPETFGDMTLMLPSSGGIIEMPPWKRAAPRERLIEELRAWADRHRIASPFVLNAAAFTVYRWDVGDDPRGQWAFPSGTWKIPGSKLEPTLPEPLKENWRASMARWRTLWDARVAELAGAGYARSRLKDEAHLDWVARVLVGRETISAIATDVHRARTAVSEAVHATADLLRLPLPRTPRSVGGR